MARLLLVCEGLDGAEIADAVGVTATVVSRWRNGAPIKYLHGSTRSRIEAILAQPDWKYVPSSPPSEAEERSAAEQAHYAAGVLWSIAQDAEHLARKAREAHTRITGKGAARKVRSADAIAATASEALADKKRLGASAKHGRQQRPPKQA